MYRKDRYIARVRVDQLLYRVKWSGRAQRIRNVHACRSVYIQRGDDDEGARKVVKQFVSVCVCVYMYIYIYCLQVYVLVYITEWEDD